VDIRDLSNQLAEATKNMTPEERSSLKKMFEEVTEDILNRQAAKGTPVQFTPTTHGTEIPDGPTDRQVRLRENFLKQVPTITTHRARAITKIAKENP
jgi:formate C-acetyltransferase